MGIDTVLDQAVHDIQTYDDLQTTADQIASQYGHDPDTVQEQLYSRIDQDPPQEQLSHDELDSLLDRMTGQIQQEYDPDAVIGISRGGNPIATALSYSLEIPCGTVDATHYEGDERLDEVRIDGEMLHNVEGDVILADNLADTGETLADVEGYLQEKDSIDTVITATLHKKPHSIIDPDIYLDDTIAWITYPWER